MQKESVYNTAVFAFRRTASNVVQRSATPGPVGPPYADEVRWRQRQVVAVGPNGETIHQMVNYSSQAMMGNTGGGMPPQQGQQLREVSPLRIRYPGPLQQGQPQQQQQQPPGQLMMGQMQPQPQPQGMTRPTMRQPGPGPQQQNLQRTLYYGSTQELRMNASQQFQQPQGQQMAPGVVRFARPVSVAGGAASGPPVPGPGPGQAGQMMFSNPGPAPRYVPPPAAPPSAGQQQQLVTRAPGQQPPYSTNTWPHPQNGVPPGQQQIQLPNGAAGGPQQHQQQQQQLLQSQQQQQQQQVPTHHQTIMVSSLRRPMPLGVPVPPPQVAPSAMLNGPDLRKVLPPFPVGHTFANTGGSGQNSNGVAPPTVPLKVGVNCSRDEREGPDGASNSPPSSNDDVNMPPHHHHHQQQQQISAPLWFSFSFLTWRVLHNAHRRLVREWVKLSTFSLRYSGCFPTNIFLFDRTLSLLLGIFYGLWAMNMFFKTTTLSIVDGSDLVTFVVGWAINPVMRVTVTKISSVPVTCLWAFVPFSFPLFSFFFFSPFWVTLTVSFSNEAWNQKPIILHLSYSNEQLCFCCAKYGCLQIVWPIMLPSDSLGCRRSYGSRSTLNCCQTGIPPSFIFNRGRASCWYSFKAITDLTYIFAFAAWNWQICDNRKRSKLLDFLHNKLGIGNDFCFSL